MRQAQNSKELTLKDLEITNARIHNLKNIDISIPKNKFVVATGISGSGKSSLIFDTIFEEGKKLYLDSIGLSSSYRDEDVVDQIKGIAPTVAVMQKVIREKNPRSLVGTKTGLINLLGSLLSVEGYYPCHSCNTPVKGALKCPECGSSGNGLLPAYFQFSSPKGMCYSCEGKGFRAELNVQEFIPDENETLADMWVRAYLYPKVKKKWNRESFLERRAIQMERSYGISLDTKMKDLPRAVKRQLLFDKSFHYGLSKMFYWKLHTDRISKDDPYYKNSVCSDCGGHRVGEYGIKTLLGGMNIGAMSNLDLNSLVTHLKRSEYEIVTPIGKKLVKDILKKLNNMINLGLGYLSLYRMMPTLSGGEVQRLLIMHHLENELEGLIYIFDEPTAGLHESEKQLLIDKAKELQSKGNSILIVEHDQNTIAQAEYLIDFGPGAGRKGGEIVYRGEPEGILSVENSFTGKYLSGKINISSRKNSEIKDFNDVNDHLSFRNITTNNLQGINVNIPLNRIVGICGVSGSGKSSLINATLVPSLKKKFIDRSEEDDNSLFGLINEIYFTGGDTLDSISVVTQAPIGRSSVSNIATYLGVWTDVRNYFVKEVGQDVYKIGDFSFNSKGGCKQCGGKGEEYIYLSDMVSMRNTCRVCHGKKYIQEILDLKIRGMNIKDILDMTVTEAMEFFRDQNTIYRKLKVFDKTGMGYITLGQSTTTISGGEAQRLKLAKQLVTRKKGHVLYIFDEPTTGLSLYDTDKFLRLVHELYKEGNSIIVIEHDPDVLSFCDHIIELGPKGGSEGGCIIAEGRPEDLISDSNSITGKYLKVYKDECVEIS